MVEIVVTLEENVNGIFINPQPVKLYLEENQISALLCAAQQKINSTGLTSRQREEIRKMIQLALDTGSA